MAKTYVVSWHGSAVESPAYEGFTQIDDAITQARQWAFDAAEGLFDRSMDIDLLMVDSDSGKVEIIGGVDGSLSEFQEGCVALTVTSSVKAYREILTVVDYANNPLSDMDDEFDNYHEQY